MNTESSAALDIKTAESVLDSMDSLDSDASESASELLQDASRLTLDHANIIAAVISVTSTEQQDASAKAAGHLNTVATSEIRVVADLAERLVQRCEEVSNEEKGENEASTHAWAAAKSAARNRMLALCCTDLIGTREYGMLGHVALSEPWEAVLSGNAPQDSMWLREELQDLFEDAIQLVTFTPQYKGNYGALEALKYVARNPDIYDIAEVMAQYYRVATKQDDMSLLPPTKDEVLGHLKQMANVTTSVVEVFGTDWHEFFSIFTQARRIGDNHLVIMNSAPSLFDLTSDVAISANNHSDYYIAHREGAQRAEGIVSRILGRRRASSGKYAASAMIASLMLSKFHHHSMSEFADVPLALPWRTAFGVALSNDSKEPGWAPLPIST